MARRRKLKKLKLHSPFSNFMNDYNIWQNCITVGILPLNIFFMIALYGITFTPGLIAAFSGLGLLFINIGLLANYLFERRKSIFVDPKYSLFFGVGLIAICFFVATESLRIIEITLMILAPASFILPLLLSPISIFLANNRLRRRIANFKAPIHFKSPTIYVITASFTGYLALSNSNFFFTLPISLFNAALNLFNPALIATITPGLIVTGTYLILFAVSGLLYSRFTYNQLFKVSRSIYNYTLYFAIGLTIIASLHVLGIPLLFASNILNIGSFIVLAIAGAIIQGRKQYIELKQEKINLSFINTLKSLSCKERQYMLDDLEKSQLVKSGQLIMSPVEVFDNNQRQHFFDRTYLQEKNIFKEPWVNRKAQNENIRYLSQRFV